MTGYDASRRPPTRQRLAQAQSALERFLTFVAAGDMAGVESLLSPGARMLSDGGGEFKAALQPVIGNTKVASFFIHVYQKVPPPLRVEPRLLNGLPAIVADREGGNGLAPRFTLQVDVDETGAITDVYIVMASRKLTAV
jgi:RNA polymerase sigma-70 factor (ECF subfamily)